MSGHYGVRNQGSIWELPLHTAAADGGAEGFSATIEVADFDIYKDHSLTQRTSTAGFTIIEGFDGVAGAHWFYADLADNTDAGFYAGGAFLACLFSPDETVDSQTLVAWIGTCDLETDYQAQARTAQTYFGGGVLAAAGTTSTIDFSASGILDTDLPDAALVNTVWRVRDASDGKWEDVVVTGYVGATQIATVARIDDGGVLAFATASGDFVWPVGVFGRGHDVDSTAVIAAVKSAMGVVSSTVAVDAGNSASEFEVSADAGAIVRQGILKFTSDNLDTEGKFVRWAGTTVTVITPDTTPAGLEEIAAYSAEPDEGASFDFWPV